MTRQIHIHIHRSSAKDAWNEADHPRAANGQFGSGGGGKSSGGSKEKHDPPGVGHAGRPQGTAAVQARIEAKRAAGQPVGFERVRKESAPGAGSPRPVTANERKDPNQVRSDVIATINKRLDGPLTAQSKKELLEKKARLVAAQKADLTSRAKAAGKPAVNTRAGYQVHIDENGTNSQGWSNEKPGTAKPVKNPPGFKNGSRGIPEARASSRQQNYANLQAAQKSLEAAGFTRNRSKETSRMYGTGTAAEDHHNYIYENKDGEKVRVLHVSVGKGGWTQIHRTSKE